MTDRKLAFVGLGNPGSEYATTRHNAGFFVVDAFAQRVMDSAAWQVKKNFLSEFVSLQVQGTTVLLAKPQTFMNNSGQAIGALARFYDLEPKQIWIIHDDLDMPLGKAQIRLGGGMAGHHGLESTADHLKTTDFGRIRIGIRGHELRSLHAQQGVDTNQFVMGNFTSQERDVLDRVISEVVGEMEKLCQEGYQETRTLTVAGYETFSAAE